MRWAAERSGSTGVCWPKSAEAATALTIEQPRNARRARRLITSLPCLRRLWPPRAFFRQPLIVFLNESLIFRQELLAERGLHLVAQLLGQMAPKAAEHVFDVGWLD